MVNPNQAARPAHRYVLGHSEHEVERLKAQARLIDPITERFLLAAGVGPGIRNLEFLRRTEVVGPKGNKVRLLDAVDMITGVSGGSFTALAYGLYGDRLFSEYEQRFLKRRVQGDLNGRALSPVYWGPLSSPYSGRSESQGCDGTRVSQRAADVVRAASRSRRPPARGSWKDCARISGLPALSERPGR